MKIGVLICAYNEEKHIRKVINQCFKYIENIIVVNDGSKDKTLSEIKKTKALILNNTINKGKGFSLKKGFDYATSEEYDYLILLDGDGQHSPNEIPKFLREIRKNYDLIIGCRRKRGSEMPYLRRFTNFSSSVLISLRIKKWIKDTQSGYRAINLKSLKDMKLDKQGYDLETEIIFKMVKKEARIKSIPIKTIYGSEISSINPIKDTLKFLKIIITK